MDVWTARRRLSLADARSDGHAGWGCTSLPDGKHCAFTGLVIVREETIVDAPPGWVRQRLQARLTADGLHPESAASFEQEHTLLVQASVAGVSKTVAMKTLPAYQRGEVTVIPFRWVATGPVGELFPTLDANLELEPTDDERTRIVLLGSYQPPLRRLGAGIDRAVLHTVATTTIHGFLTQLTATLQPAAQTDAQAAPAPAPDWGGTHPATA